MHKDYYTRILFGLFLVMLLCQFSSLSWAHEPNYVKVSVIDGDTLLLKQKKGSNKQYERIRLIGIDAPEMDQHPWGLRSKRHLQEILACQGGLVRLEYDVESRDRYGRLLAYVWLSNGIFVNERMVSDGYALAMTISPNVRYTDLLFAAQQKARQHRVGLWKENAFAETPRHWRKLHPNPL